MTLIVKLIANHLHPNASTAISGHQKLPACWVHSGCGVFSTMLKLSIRSRLITAVHLALNSHINAVWKSQNRAKLLPTVETLSVKSHLGRMAFPILVADCF